MSKKPKEIEGVMVERQRLILDCRQVNLSFRAPPVTELFPLVGRFIWCKPCMSKLV